MIRKNAVESILAERDILITVRNPFVVSGPNLLVILFYAALRNAILVLTFVLILLGSIFLFFYMS